jgi:hypothetical protein
MTGSVRAVRKALALQATGLIPDDADGTLAAHVAELERRVHRLRQRGGALRNIRLASGVHTVLAPQRASA